jgi:tryptophan synthase alpha chain
VKNRLVQQLERLRARNGRGLAPFITAGDGGLDVTLAVLRALDKCDVPCVELGLPFSDPIADGPILQNAAQRALSSGTTFDAILEMLIRFRRGSDGFLGSDLPIAIMSYANPLVRRGLDRALPALAQAGADGILVADMPVEEAGPMESAARRCGLAPIFFVAPSTTPARMESAIAHSQGFVYAIGRFGVTGESTDLDAQAQEFLARVRTAAKGLPVGVGFGITNAEQVAAATRHADIAIVGSALVEHIHQAVRAARVGRPEAAADAARAFLAGLAKGIAA